MRNKGKKFTWTDEAQVSFENIKRELCEALIVPLRSAPFNLRVDNRALAWLKTYSMD